MAQLLQAQQLDEALQCARQATEAMAAAGWKFAVRQTLGRALARPDAIPQAGELWSAHSIRVLRLPLLWGKFGWLLWLRGRGRGGASVAFAAALLAANHRRLLWLYVLCFWRRLQADTWNWGNICHLLSSASLERLGVRWIGQYRQRQGLEMWMLVNAADCLVARGQFAPAAELGRFAASLPADHTDGSRRRLLALAEALFGNYDAARQALQQALDPAANTHYQALQELTESLIAVATAAPADRPNLLRNRRQRIRLACDDVGSGRNATLRRARTACAWRLARLGGGIRGWAGLVVDLIEAWCRARASAVGLAGGLVCRPWLCYATSDAGLPVGYYVASGPAVIDNGKLRLAEVPARAQFPLKIVVVAWQYGSGIAPQVQTAAPVSQEILFEK